MSKEIVATQCAWCTRIRCGSVWVDLADGLVATYNDRPVTHGICPKCQKRILVESANAKQSDDFAEWLEKMLAYAENMKQQKAESQWSSGYYAGFYCAYKRAAEKYGIVEDEEALQPEDAGWQDDRLAAEERLCPVVSKGLENK